MDINYIYPIVPDNWMERDNGDDRMNKIPC